ncbi:MAG TPA: CBS domain-containing protein [Flavitalea sp.]|nr:CBS domain-containing protein [Flavitalea sp.]
MRRVKDIIASKPEAFNSISPEALVFDALQLLNSVNLSYLIVLEGDKYKGIFSERDYTRNVILKGRSSKDTIVEQVMTTDYPKVEVTDTVEYCMNLINTHKTRYLLAFDDQNFVGVITIHDLLRQVIASKEEVFDHTLTNQLLDNAEGGGRIY